MKKTIHVKAIWDTESQVWVADSNDVPGLVTEADTSEQLIHKLQIIIPELLEANGLIGEWKEMDIPFYLQCERNEIIEKKGMIF